MQNNPNNNPTPVIEWLQHNTPPLELAAILDGLLEDKMRAMTADAVVVHPKDDLTFVTVRSFRNVLLKSGGVFVFE
jgi:hypothetical protein